MASRTIKLFGDPLLRKKSAPVEVVDQGIKLLLKDLADTMYSIDNCGGLAAPQIGVLKRLLVIDMGCGLIQMVNPRIIISEGRQKVVEGCMSIPNTYGLLERPARVTVQGLNENGDQFTLRASKDLAKCICHEIDHLDGILFTDLITEYVELKMP
ncbi:MAG: peptide deformylase [Syntrophomonas sp.]